MLQNLVGGFGANTTFFAYLKTHDRNSKGKDIEENRARAVIHANVTEVYRAAAQLVPMGKLDIVEADVDVPISHCSQKGDAKLREYSAVPGNETLYDKDWRGYEFLQSGLSQVKGAHWCGEAIEEYVAATGVVFDVVFRFRPDLSFPMPMSPHCKWNLNRLCRARDWFWMLPGWNAVASLKRGYEGYKICEKGLVYKGSIVETFMASGMGKVLTAEQKQKIPLADVKAKNFVMKVRRHKETIAPLGPSTLVATCGW